MGTANIQQIEVEARRVYGSNRYVKFECDSNHGTSLTVGSKASLMKRNEISVHSWHEQQALDAVFQALLVLPSHK
jgi:uncharacterized protein YbaA (DUF1428 family)